MTDPNPTDTSNAHPGNRTPGDILLDAGTNEFEVLEFGLGNGRYGVNVAKVREVILPVRCTASPGQHSSVLGMINIRGLVIPVVDLRTHLGLNNSDGKGDRTGRVIITEFNGKQTGFMVDDVYQIHRIAWTEAKSPPELSSRGECGAITSILDYQDRLILLLDFESISDEICIEQQLHIHSVDNIHNVDRGTMRVIMAEDSNFVRNAISDVFTTSGYTKIELYPNGQKAWDVIRASKHGGKKIDAIISDIEMPCMDGLHLCKQIKEDPELRDIPVLLFSSLISSDNLKKGQQVGANAQVAKPDLPEMVIMVDRLILGMPVESATAPSETAAAA